MAAATVTERSRLIKLIHVARRDLERAGKMDEPTYRTMLRTAGGADSTTKMGVPALERVLAQAKKAGFEVRTKAGDRRQDTRPEARKVRALWLFLHELGVVKNPSEAALAAYVLRIAKVDDMHWAHGEAMHRLIETMKKWAMRFLPDVVYALRDQVRLQLLTQTGPLLKTQEDLYLRATLSLGAGQGFDRHWDAWVALAEAAGKLVPAEIRSELGDAA